jgi:Ser/Thr protein kinase RdoA (MazF antagonist)
VDVAAEVAREYHLGPVLDFRRATAGIMNLNWSLVTEAGTFAVKLLRDATPGQVRAVQRVLPRMAELGIRVPIARTTRDGEMLLRVGGDWYTVFDWLPGHHPVAGELDPGPFGELVGRLHLALAETARPAAPPTVTDRPASVAEAVAGLQRYAERSGELGDQIAWRLGLLAEIADQRPAAGEIGPAGWTHGDLQPFNLLVEDGRVSGVLDWDRLGVRTYGLEVVRTATITFDTDLDRISAFARGYRVHHPVSDFDLEDAAHRRWWVLATGSWPLGWHEDVFVRRNRYLRWWTGHRAEVTAALTRR